MINFIRSFLITKNWGVIELSSDLSFQDGILLCKYIYQNAIDKTLNGVIEQEEIFYKAYDMLKKVDKGFDYERLDEILSLLNIDSLYVKI